MKNTDEPQTKKERLHRQQAIWSATGSPRKKKKNEATLESLINNFWKLL